MGLASCSRPRPLSIIDWRWMHLLGPALIALKGPASLEAQELYPECLRIGGECARASVPLPTMRWGWWRVSQDFSVKKQRASTLLARAVSRGDPELLLQAHHCNWATHFGSCSDFARCAGHIEGIGLGIYRAGNFPSPRAPVRQPRRSGLWPRRTCTGRVDAGSPAERARAQEHEAHRWAGELGHVGFP